LNQENIMSACYFCGKELDPKMRIVKDTECPHCGRDLHACVQCRHFDRSAHNMCREPQAEWVTDRERRNFCDYFSLNPMGKGAGKGAVGDRASAARSKLDSLFKTKEPDKE
jgi:predicted RNA-binding Zn-ribbon protein involved in translation (DUF1610 family)